MKKNGVRTGRALIRGALLGLVVTTSFSSTSRAETGEVRLVLTKAGFIVGVGRGKGTLTFRGRDYLFNISQLSLGATIELSTNKVSGEALNMVAPGDLAGTYSMVGGGLAAFHGPVGVQLRNKKGVILQLHGFKLGAALTANVGGARITMK
jgi:hypothetical protein